MPARVSVDVLTAGGAAWAGLRRALGREGLRCACAPTPERAIRLARRHMPLCVLLDLDCYGLGGPALARRLRSDPCTSHIPVLCLPGRYGGGLEEEARRSGCAGFLAAPVDVPALLTMLGLRGLTLAQTGELLDWLENSGRIGLKVTSHQGGGFAVGSPT